MIVAGRQLDPELREPLARAGRSRRLSDPRRADLAAALRPHDRSQVVIGLRPAAARRALRPFGRARPGAPLRRDADQQAAAPWLAASGADQIVVDPYGGWNEPTRPRGGDPARRPDRAGGRAGRAARDAAGARAPRRWLDAERGRARGVRDPSSRASDELPSPALHLALGRAYRDGDLVYTASSMPIRDQEAFLPPSDADVLFLCNRGANGIDGLVSSGIGAAHGERPADHDRHRRPRPPPRPRRPRRAARRLDPGPDRRDRQRRRRDLPLPAPGRERSTRGVRGAARHPARRRRRQGRRAVRPPPPPPGRALGELPDALAAGTGLIEVRRPGDNVEIHRRLSVAVSTNRSG